MKHKAERVILYQKVIFSFVTRTVPMSPPYRSTEVYLKKSWALFPYSDRMVVAAFQCSAG